MPKKELRMAPEKIFWFWINERHRIYLKRKNEEPWPWTKNDILKTYKFTNVFRELDSTTKWMRSNWTKKNKNRPHPEIIFNCVLYRYFGTIEMAKAIGWVSKWDPGKVMSIADKRLLECKKVFTGAYMITNGGSHDSKSSVIVNQILTPLWKNRLYIADSMAGGNTLYHAWKVLREFRGFGGTGFMAYEAVSDLRHTQVLRGSTDMMKWANAGPGCIRGLRRLFEDANRKNANDKMLELLERSDTKTGDHVPAMEMRDIEHSLCEFDKYCRVKYGEGRPRSRYTYKGED